MEINLIKTVDWSDNKMLIGKEAEKRVHTWLDRPEEGYCLDRLKDQVSGYLGS